MPALVLHGTESAQIADFNSCYSALLMGIWRTPRRDRSGTWRTRPIISAHRHSLRLSFDTLQSAQPRPLDSGSIDVDMLLDDHGAATMKGTDFTACTPSKSINPFLLKAGQHVQQNSHTLTALRKDLWLQYEMPTPLHIFPARFLLLPAQSFTEHNRYALGVIVGDEGMYRRYEADFSYGLLGTRDNRPHQAC
jgi:hypothetical protein